MRVNSSLAQATSRNVVVLAEFGDYKNRYADAKARRNYAGTNPITRQSGKKKVVLGDR